MNLPTLALIAAPPDPLRYSLQALLARLPQIDAVQSVEDTRSMLATLDGRHRSWSCWTSICWVTRPGRCWR